MLNKFIVSRDDSVYEAFPALELTVKEHLICVFLECVSHGDRSNTRIVYVKSEDRGRSWGEKICLTESDPEQMYYDDCPSIKRLRDGRLVILINKCARHEPMGNAGGRHARTWMYIGDSDGNEWSAPIETPIEGIVPDTLLELDSGRWLVTAHYESKEHGFLEQMAWYTDNQGTTWSGPITVASQSGLHLCEGSVLPLPNGVLVCYMRENSHLGLDAYKAISYDQGESWEGLYTAPIPACHRPVARMLASGLVLITYRFMQGGKGWLGFWTQNVFACLTDAASAASTERDDQWSRIFPLDYDRSPESDLGYTGSVQFADGEIYVVNYIVDDAPKAHIRGYAFYESDLLLTS